MEEDKKDCIEGVKWRWDEQVKMLRKEAEELGGCLDSRAMCIIERMHAAFVEGCRDAYALGKHNPETAEAIDRRYRMFMKNDIEHTRLQVAARAMSGIMAGMTLAEAWTNIHNIDCEVVGRQCAKAAVYAADRLLEELASAKEGSGL